VEAGPSVWRLLGRGVTRRCPACGSGGLFETWFRLRERCPRCAARLEREPGFFIGAYFLNFCLMQVVLGAWIVVAFAFTLPDPPMALILGVALAICVVLPVVGYPFSKTTWAAIHLAMAPLEPDEEADAAVHRFERGDAAEPPP
jgi:uncharacterized protein (DUF983 family)